MSVSTYNYIFLFRVKCQVKCIVTWSSLISSMIIRDFYFSWLIYELCVNVLLFINSQLFRCRWNLNFFLYLNEQKRKKKVNKNEALRTFRLWQYPDDVLNDSAISSMKCLYGLWLHQDCNAMHPVYLKT